MSRAFKRSYFTCFLIVIASCTITTAQVAVSLSPFSPELGTKFYIHKDVVLDLRFQFRYSGVSGNSGSVSWEVNPALFAYYKFYREKSVHIYAGPGGRYTFNNKKDQSLSNEYDLFLLGGVEISPLRQLRQVTFNFEIAPQLNVIPYQDKFRFRLARFIVINYYFGKSTFDD
jgi:hypothetical protein